MVRDGSVLENNKFENTHAQVSVKNLLTKEDNWSLNRHFTNKLT